MLENMGISTRRKVEYKPYNKPLMIMIMTMKKRIQWWEVVSGDMTIITVLFVL